MFSFHNWGRWHVSSSSLLLFIHICIIENTLIWEFILRIFLILVSIMWIRRDNLYIHWTGHSDISQYTENKLTSKSYARNLSVFCNIYLIFCLWHVTVWHRVWAPVSIHIFKMIENYINKINIQTESLICSFCAPWVIPLWF